MTSSVDRCARCTVVRRSHDPSDHPFIESDREKDVDAAHEFLERCCLTPTPDAVDQLVDAILPALRIMCERGYDPEGGSWRESGWMGQMAEIRKRASRLVHHSWRHGRFDFGDAVDMINYCGFYLRLEGKGKPWGEWGEPGDG
jgi:hypothetical protein